MTSRIRVLLLNRCRYCTLIVRACFHQHPSQHLRQQTCHRRREDGEDITVLGICSFLNRYWFSTSNFDASKRQSFPEAGGDLRCLQFIVDCFGRLDRALLRRACLQVVGDWSFKLRLDVLVSHGELLRRWSGVAAIRSGRIGLSVFPKALYIHSRMNIDFWRSVALAILASLSTKPY
jgi:hypothetical protein